MSDYKKALPQQNGPKTKFVVSYRVTSLLGGMLPLLVLSERASMQAWSSILWRSENSCGRLVEELSGLCGVDFKLDNVDSSDTLNHFLAASKTPNPIDEKAPLANIRATPPA